jgi:hypothetical protein
VGLQEKRRLKGIHYRLIEGLEGASIDDQLRTAQRVLSGNAAGCSPIIEILLGEWGRWSRKWIRGADGSENSASGWNIWTFYCSCCVRLNCSDTCMCSKGATDCIAPYTKRRISLCNTALEKCEPSEAQWLLYIPPGYILADPVIIHTVRLSFVRFFE